MLQWNFVNNYINLYLIYFYTIIRRRNLYLKLLNQFVGKFQYDYIVLGNYWVYMFLKSFHSVVYQYKLGSLIFLWNKISKLYFFNRNRVRMHDRQWDQRLTMNLYYFNINLLLSINFETINLFYHQKFVNMSYFVVRLYMYILQQICCVKLNFYFTRIGKNKLKNYLHWGQFKKSARNLIFFLKWVRISRTFIFIFIWAVWVRDVLIILYCMRKVIISISSRGYRRFLFTIQLFLKKILTLLNLYCGLNGYKFELSGKFGRGGAQRANKYIFQTRMAADKRINYFCYNYVQIRLVLGAISLHGLLVY